MSTIHRMDLSRLKWVKPNWSANKRLIFLLSYFLIPHEPQIEFQCGQVPHLCVGFLGLRQIKLIFNQKNNRNWHRWHNAYLRTKWLDPRNELVSDLSWTTLVILKIHHLYYISNSFTSSNCRFCYSDFNAQ